MQNIKGFRLDAASMSISDNSVVYIDPPYIKGTQYGQTLDLQKVLNNCVSNPVFVSESQPLDNAIAVKVSIGSLKGGITWDRKKAHEEWLCYFGKDTETISRLNNTSY